jgi:hypothetical protein
MINLIYNNGILIYESQEFTLPDLYIVGEFVYVNLFNEHNDVYVAFHENYTTINGVLQTSAQMIIDTLTNA